MTISSAVLFAVIASGPARPVPPAIDFSDLQRDFKARTDDIASSNRRLAARLAAGGCVVLGGAAAAVAMANKAALTTMPADAPIAEKQSRITSGTVAAATADGLFVGAILIFGLSFAF